MRNRKNILINNYGYNYDDLINNYHENVTPIFKVNIIKPEKEYIINKNDKKLSGLNENVGTFYIYQYGIWR